MLLGLGLDVVDPTRLARALERHGRLLEERIFTARELDDCASRESRVVALAARFAAKEACLKALGTGFGRGVSFRDVEVIRDGGAPRVALSGRAAERASAMGVTRVHVSLTHERDVAAAVVVLESGD